MRWKGQLDYSAKCVKCMSVCEKGSETFFKAVWIVSTVRSPENTEKHKGEKQAVHVFITYCRWLNVWNPSGRSGFVLSHYISTSRDRCIRSMDWAVKLIYMQQDALVKHQKDSLARVKFGTTPDELVCSNLAVVFIYLFISCDLRRMKSVDMYPVNGRYLFSVSSFSRCMIFFLFSLLLISL